MHHHRFQHLIEQSYPIPRAPHPAVAPTGFMVCPVAIAQFLPCPLHAVQLALYQQAFELAREMARPSIVELDLLGVWN
jgi:hypothetical protein